MCSPITQRQSSFAVRICLAGMSLGVRRRASAGRAKTSIPDLKNSTSLPPPYSAIPSKSLCPSRFIPSMLVTEALHPLREHSRKPDVQGDHSSETRTFAHFEIVPHLKHSTVSSNISIPSSTGSATQHTPAASHCSFSLCHKTQGLS